MYLRILGFFVIFLGLLPLSAQAHRLNESYIYFDVTDDSFGGRFEATLEDINRLIPLDADENGEITEAEFQAKATEIFAFFQDRLNLASEGQSLPISYSEATTLGTEQGKFAQLWFDVPDLTNVPDTLEMDYEPLADVLGNGHTGYALIGSNSRLGLEDNERYISLVFRTGDEPQTLSLVGEPLGKLFFDFVKEGIWHIWLGFDHVVFLITLLLPAVLFAANSRWTAEKDFRTSFWNVVKIVTLFTLSHSVTLALAATGIVQLPVVLVESIIAISIAVVALMNLFPALHKWMLWIVFGFGLFHGFGFANVLAPLGLAPAQLLVGLVAFNIGVEFGQLVIVAIVFPILWVIRRWSLYIPLGLQFGSLALIALAGVWLLERTTEFEWDVRATISAIGGMFT